MKNIITTQHSQALNSILNNLNQLNSNELDVLFLQLKKRRWGNYPIILSKKESDLFQAINAGLPGDLNKRFDELRKKQTNETITDLEYKELLKLIEHIEQFDVERLKNLIALAKMKDITLAELSEKLELKTKIYNA